MARRRRRAETVAPAPTVSSLPVSRRASINLKDTAGYLCSVRAGSLFGVHEACKSRLAELGAEPDDNASISGSGGRPTGNLGNVVRFVQRTSDVAALQIVDAIVRRRLVDAGAI